LIERAEAAMDAELAQDQTERMLSGQFTLEDFITQLRQIRDRLLPRLISGKLELK